MNLLTALSLLFLGTGSGGLIGTYIAYRRQRMEERQTDTTGKVSLRSVDVDQFKALFPGGLGDAVQHWRDEAENLFQEVQALRVQRLNDHETLIEVKMELTTTQHTLMRTQAELEEARRRITDLEKRDFDA